MGGSSNYQIDNYYRKEPLYGGCFSKDQLKNKKPSGKFFIINLQDSDAGQGSHWVCVIDFLPKITVAIDSFAVHPPPEVVTFMRKSGKPCKYSTVQYQEINSDNCGEFCLAFIDELLKQLRSGNIHPSQFDKGFTPRPSAHNEEKASRVDARLKN